MEKDKKEEQNNEKQEGNPGDIFPNDGNKDIVKYMIEKETKTYMKNGKQVYEILLPFSMDDFYEVSKEEYDQYIQKHWNIFEEKAKDYEEGIKHKERFEKSGITKFGSERNITYETRILDLLEQKGIQHINEIPEKTGEIQEDNKIAIFQTLAKKNKEPDFYEKTIEAFLEKYEKEIEYCYIKDDEILDMENFFIKGRINDLSLLYRFENLKKSNINNHFKRIYTFGKEYEYIANESTPKSDFLNDDEARNILYFLTYANGTCSDLGADEKKVKEKFLKSYKKELKNSRLGNSGQRFGNKYSGFRREVLKESLEITDEELDTLHKEALEEIKEEYETILDQSNFDSINASTIHNIGIIIINIKKGATKDNEDIETTIEKTISSLKRYISEGINKIKNREKPIKAKRGQRKQLSYRYQIASIVADIDNMEKELIRLDPDQAGQTERQKNKERYITEYTKFFQESFTQKKLAQVLSTDITDKEGIEKELFIKVKEHFDKTCRKRLKEKLDIPMKYNPLTNRRVISYIINAFFKTGYALVLKKIYPDDKERKQIRQRYVQTITSEILAEINKNLSKGETFSPIDYAMKEPLEYLYKKYGGTENIKIEDDIRANYNIYIKNQFKKEIEETINKFDTYINEDKSKEEIIDLYIKTNGFTRLIGKYFHEFLKCDNSIKKENKDESIDYYYQENIRNNINKYPESFISDISFFGYNIENIKNGLSDDIFETTISMYKKLDNIKSKIIENLVYNRFITNGQLEGKLYRMSKELLFKKFGILQNSKEQTEYLIEFLTENLANIIINDFEHKGTNTLFWSDKLILEKLVKTFMENFSTQIRNQIELETDNFRNHLPKI